LTVEAVAESRPCAAGMPPLTPLPREPASEQFDSRLDDAVFDEPEPRSGCVRQVADAPANIRSAIVDAHDD
jgi:hypothetical protein